MDPWPARALIAALGLERPNLGPGDALPPFWHWLHFREAARRCRLGPDGHPAKGEGLTPPVLQARRMWAGGRLEIHAPLALGAPAERVSEITAITPKNGRAGAMSFVTIRHEITAAGGLALTEEQDIVYRDDPAPGAPPREPLRARTDETHRRDWCCDPVMLFRYSALTFNSHRIHYDRDHAMRTEGYPGLVVHGPLLATLLLELVHEIAGDAPLEEFAFRATAPVFDGERFEACAVEEPEGFELWVRGPDGRLAMTATARLHR